MTTADGAREFTEQEFQYIFGVCLGLLDKDIPQLLGIAEDVVQDAMISIFDKLGNASSRAELHAFAREALNAELRHRRLSPGDSGAAMGG